MLFFGVCVSLSQPYVYVVHTWSSFVYFRSYLLTERGFVSPNFVVGILAEYICVFCVRTHAIAFVNTKNGCTLNWKIFANKSLFEIGHNANKWNSNIVTMYVWCEYTTKSHANTKSCCFSRAQRTNWKNSIFPTISIHLTNETQIQAFKCFRSHKLLTTSLIKAKGIKFLWFF